MTASQRYDYLDIAKGFGILSVVWAHIMLVGWSHTLIYAFHMPLFFFISGMLFKREKYPTLGDFIKKRCRRLFIPYIIYSVATWIVWAVFRYITHSEVESYWMPLAQTIIAQGSGAYLVHNSVLWFIPCLFATEIFFFIFSTYFQEKGIFILCFSLAAASFLCGAIWKNEYWFLLPWNLDAAFIALPFYCVGNILSRHYSHKSLMQFANERTAILTLVIIILTILLFAGSEYFGECSMGSSSYQCNGFIFIVRAFIGCFSTLLFSLLISVLYTKAADANLQLASAAFVPFYSFVKWMGRDSLDVMCLHIPVKGIVMIVLASLLGITSEYISETFSLSFLAFLITIAIVSILVASINKIFRKHQ